MEDSKLIYTKNLIKDYPIGGGYFRALKDVNISFKEGEFAGLVGPSGSGKTTLLNIIGALDNPTKGSAVVLGRQVESLSQKQAALLRNQYLGFIFSVEKKYRGGIRETGFDYAD